MQQVKSIQIFHESIYFLSSLFISDKSASDTHMVPPLNPQSPDSDKHIPDSVPDTATTSVTATLPPSKDSQEAGETGNQSSDDVPKNSNTSDSEESETENDDTDFTYFSSENSEKVESYTDSSQGPIVALALGLAITLILLIFVGCRLRNVKRRLRKGRALHSNEADYLINGMYL